MENIRGIADLKEGDWVHLKYMEGETEVSELLEVVSVDKYSHNDVPDGAKSYYYLSRKTGKGAFKLHFDDITKVVEVRKR